MENVSARKIKQKIAKRMVEFSALNESRRYTDSGEPIRFRSSKETQLWTTCLVRTISDPEVNKVTSEGSGLNHSTPDLSSISDNYEPYTAVGSHEDIRNYDDGKRQSVQEILSNFEQRKELEHIVAAKSARPIPKSRPPKQILCESSLQDANNEDKKKVEKKPEKSNALPETQTPPYVSPKSEKKPKPKVKPLELVDSVKNKIMLLSSPKKECSNDFVDAAVNNAGNIVSDKLKEQTMNNSEENMQNYDKLKPILDIPCYNPVKQSSTKYGNYVEVAPYAIVTLEHESGKQDVLSPTLPEKKSPIQQSIVIKNEEMYLSPIDANCKSPVKIYSKTGSIEETSVEKVNKYNKKKKMLKEKSLTFTDSPPKGLFEESALRRQSLPDYLVPMTYSPQSVYEIISPVASDDEGWDNDELDSSEDEDFSCIANTKPIPKLTHLDGVQKKIYYIVTEILTTERAYVKRLYLLDKIFQEKILKEAKENGVIPEKVVNEIFPNLSPIYTFHSTILLPELEKRVQEWSTIDKIGDIFKTLGHCLLLYTEFVKNFDHAITTLSYWLKKSPKFSAVVEELQKRPECENLTLQHHMLEPVQRVPRYKLLLTDYLKKLPSDSPDRAESEASLVIISKAAEHANNSMKENEKFKKLLDIEDRILDGLNGESLVTASRVFVKEGELIKIAARSGSKMTRDILLFNDCLLCCLVTTTGKLRVRQIMDLSGLTIDEEDEMLPENAFRIKSKQRILDLACRSDEEKDEWVRAIRTAVAEFNERRGNTIERMLAAAENDDVKIGQTAPLWVKDEDVTMCMLCACKFGVVHRKHHCRGCGRVVCDKCSNYRASLAYARNTIKRVCFGCSKKLGQAPEDHTYKPKLRKSVFTRDSTVFSDISAEMWWKPPGKNWSKEWLVLADFVLYIQKKRQDVKAHTQIPVPGFQVDNPGSADEIDITHPYCIKLHKENKKELTYWISSDNKEIIPRWQEHLRLAVCLKKLSTVTNAESPTSP